MRTSLKYWWEITSKSKHRDFSFLGGRREGHQGEHSRHEECKRKNAVLTSYVTIETAFLQLVPEKHKIMNGKVDCLNYSCALASQYTLVQFSFILF